MRSLHIKAMAEIIIEEVDEEYYNITAPSGLQSSFVALAQSKLEQIAALKEPVVKDSEHEDEEFGAASEQFDLERLLNVAGPEGPIQICDIKEEDDGESEGFETPESSEAAEISVAVENPETVERNSVALAVSFPLQATTVCGGRREHK
ncbi:unnamed protein product [Fusarium equiseti]|uniref:Uncharacterized protein n=1 Tax=Fusarium equiseti TaxID=61235 RepID=A0A8J2IYQ5_FUSEQ|nr:unnamed protein product [Fusarium equiseti]